MIKQTGRSLAWQTLNRVETEQAYANLALATVLAAAGPVDQREKAFCTELVYGTLRHWLKMDYLLGRLLSRPLTSLKIPVKNLLRLALYQLIHLPDIPERAVCHTMVALIKGSKYSGLAGLVNGVLRNFIRLGKTLELPDPGRDLTAYLTVEYSHPRWLVTRWLERFGPDRTKTILEVDNARPPLTVRANRLAGQLPQLRAELQQSGVASTVGLLLPEALHLHDLPVALEELAAFQAGKITPQDESSMLIAPLVAPRPGETIVDLCAAPGGKSTHLAELMQDQGCVFSLDDHPHKVELIAANARRLNLTALRPLLGDARDFSLPDGGLADAVLVDAPCSGTGVLRRRVDARYRRTETEIGRLANLQREILDQAASLVKPGGRLVYSTCTLEPEENQQQIAAFVTAHPDFKAVTWQPFLPSALALYLEDSGQKWATILPTPEGGDGFFICRLERSQ
jgi:16S rRNA (cytosine967-C5)-methyltransferase